MDGKGITLGTLAAATMIGGAAFAQSSIGVTVNGDSVNFTGQPPVSESGRVLVPLRGVLEKIGAEVRYSGPTKTVQATKGDTKIQLTLGERAATVNGKDVTLDVPAQARSGATLVPLRFVAEALGADVRYDGKYQLVAIRTDGKPNVIVPPAGGSGTGQVADSSQPPAKSRETFTGTFVDFAGQDDNFYTLKMTDGRTVQLRKDAKLLYQNQEIGFDDLRSGDKVVATLNQNGRGIKAVISDDDF